MKQNTNAKIVSPTGKVIEDLAVRKFERHLLGEILRPGENSYEAARRIWIGIIDPRRPAMIVRCATVTDVARSVEFARSNKMAVAVRGGGHSLTGDSFCDGGMVIDLSRMNTIYVNGARCVARADAGLTARQFDRATKAFGLAGVMGECSSVGIAGFTLGGGLGRLMGRYGAACDNLLSAELIGSDGNLLRASADENADLFLGDSRRRGKLRNRDIV
jgi:FAD/FMN-containing dehydrogenase